MSNISQPAEAPEPVSDQELLYMAAVSSAAKEIAIGLNGETASRVRVEEAILAFKEIIKRNIPFRISPDQRAELSRLRSDIERVNKFRDRLASKYRSREEELEGLRERVKALEGCLGNCRDFIELRKTHSGTVESWRRSVLDEVSKLLTQPAKEAQG